MIVELTMKDPDSLQDACDEAAKKSLKANTELDEEERGLLQETRSQKANELICEKFMEYGEYITVRFDTEKGTAEVVPR